MLNEKIREFRIKKGLSQEELADKLCVVRQTVSKWEKGISVPDADKLLALSKALEVSVNVLLGIDEAQNPDEVFNALSRLKNKRRKTIRIICIVVLVIALLMIAGTFLFCYSLNHMDVNTDMAVIGGADAPTAIFVHQKWKPTAIYLIAGIMTVVSSIGIYITKKKTE